MSENGPQSDEASGEPALAFDDELYRALASRERRRLLSLLLDEEERTVEELATLLLGWDVTASGTVGDPDDRWRTILRLRHSHLPILDEIGVVSYDPDSGTVRAEPLDTATVELIERGVDTEGEPPR
ncbi:ArsR family transcriptional regulator [Halolamina sp. CBA1230]|uniref:DUF7344 domain-containing protein n=1 Tax=Halolamina sp. CBA1230 TaxID=1853690 RepID=UPI0009A24C12|nr:hypothetical protein [Halolamina sp. CBA1230]QKY19169.1 ArsR family transcriptional regulator [Halolamina sp. CBA1230]